MSVAAAAVAGSQRLGQSEVQHLHGAVRAHLDVRWFEIAMNDPLLVRGFGASAICLAIGNASSTGTGLRAMRSASSSPSTSSITSAVDAVDSCSRKWRRCSGDSARPGLRPPAETGRAARRLCQRWWQGLQRDVPFELGITGPINLPHAARPKPRHDLIRPDLATEKH